jgi:hypothetical protein
MSRVFALQQSFEKFEKIELLATVEKTLLIVYFAVGNLYACFASKLSKEVLISQDFDVRFGIIISRRPKSFASAE